MHASHDFTEGKILSPLVRFASPVFVALFLQSLYGAVDLLVVGHYGQAANVSAVSVGAMVMQTLTFVVSDIAMGATILIARKMGEKKETDVGVVIGSSIAFFIVIGIVLTIVIPLLARPMALALQAPIEALEGTISYIRICSYGFLCIVGYNLLGSVFRGMGDSMMPLFSVVIACVCNIAGDLYFVAVLHMGESGAAIATVISQAVSVLVSFLMIKRRGFSFQVKVRLDKNVAKDTLSLGFPIALQDLLVSISFLVIAAIVNRIGLVASASVGIAERVCGFIMLVPSSFMQSMSAFVAQNIGAGKQERANRALWYCIFLSLGCGLVMFFVTFFHGNTLSGIFTQDPVLIASAWDYLKAYAIDCILTSFLFSMMGYYNGMGKTKFVLIQGVVGAFAVRIPVSLFMSTLKPVSLFWVGLATPSSSLVQIVLCLCYYFALRHKETARYMPMED